MQHKASNGKNYLFSLQSIELSPNFAGGESFREILEIIAHQMHQVPDLKVHILVSKDLLEELDIQFLEGLSTHPNSHFLITDRDYVLFPIPHFEENHVKLLLIDEKYFVIGGLGIHPRMAKEITLDSDEKPRTSFKSKFLDQRFRDTDIIGESPAAFLMRKHFFELYQKWESKTYKQQALLRFYPIQEQRGECPLFHDSEGLFRNVKLKCIHTDLNCSNRNPITEEINRLILRSQRKIRIANLFFSLDDVIRDCLHHARKQGVRVTAILNGETNFFHKLYTKQNRIHYDQVDTVYEYDRPKQLYHKKIFVFDQVYTIVGSYNLGIKSNSYDDEMVVLMKDPRIAQSFIESLSEDKKYSKKYTATDLKVIASNEKLVGGLVKKLLENFWG